MLEALLGKAAGSARAGWAKLAATPLSHEGHGAAAVGTDLYVFGGNTTNTLKKYDTLTNIWTTLPQVGPASRRKFGMTALGKKLYIYGGITTTGWSVFSDFWCFDTELMTWESLPVPGGVSSGAALVVRGSLIYSFGGSNDNGVFYNSVYVYDPAKRAWTYLGGLPSTVSMGVAAVVEGKFYYYGGNTSNGKTVAVVSSSVDGVKWVAEPPAPIARYLLAGDVVDDVWYVFGGAYGAMSEPGKFTPSGGWVRLKVPIPNPSARYSHTFTAIDGKLYMVGGYGTTNEMWVFTP